MEAILISQPDENVHLTDALISSGLATSRGGKAAYTYQLSYYMYYDYYYLQQDAANSELNTPGVRHLVASPFVPIYSGQYPVFIGYYLPGKSEAHSRQQFTITKQ